MNKAPCSNCGSPQDILLPRCTGCQEAIDNAGKLADAINNHLERGGFKLRFNAETVRAAALAERRGKKGKS